MSSADCPPDAALAAVPRRSAVRSGLRANRRQRAAPWKRVSAPAGRTGELPGLARRRSARPHGSSISRTSSSPTTRPAGPSRDALIERAARGRHGPGALRLARLLRAGAARLLEPPRAVRRRGQGLQPAAPERHRSGSAAITGSLSPSTAGSGSSPGSASPTAGQARRHRARGATRALPSRDPLVADLDAAFAESWALAGAPIAVRGTARPRSHPSGRDRAGARDQRPTGRRSAPIGSTSSSRRWRSATFGSPTPISSPPPPMCRRLREAARDGVDVRLLVPGSSDVPVAPADRAGGIPLADRGRHPRLRVERPHAARQDRRRRRPLVAGRARPTSTSRAGRPIGSSTSSSRTPNSRAAMEAMYPGGPRQRDRDRSGRAATLKSPACARVRPRRVAGRIRSRTSRRRPSRRRRHRARQHRRQDRNRRLAFPHGTEASSIAIIGLRLLSAARDDFGFPSSSSLRS